MITEDVSHEFLKTGLDSRDEKGNYPVLLAEDCNLGMRGLDYRARRHGILLLVLRSFQHSRQAVQAAFRVGRNGDPCQRQRLAQVPLVDEAMEAKYKASLSQFMQAQLPVEPRPRSGKKKSAA